MYCNVSMLLYIMYTPCYIYKIYNINKWYSKIMFIIDWYRYRMHVYMTHVCCFPYIGLHKIHGITSVVYTRTRVISYIVFPDVSIIAHICMLCIYDGLSVDKHHTTDIEYIYIYIYMYYIDNWANTYNRHTGHRLRYIAMMAWHVCPPHVSHMYTCQVSHFSHIHALTMCHGFTGYEAYVYDTIEYIVIDNMRRRLFSKQTHTFSIGYNIMIIQ